MNPLLLLLSKSLITVLQKKSLYHLKKYALVRLLLKKVDLDIENMAYYRPVSNLSFLSKIMEHAILDQLLPLLKDNKVIPLLQSAYKGCHSAEMALCRVHNNLVLNTCAGKSSILVLLDFSAAFDTINHQMLLEYLLTYRFQGSALSLLESNLADRLQKIVVSVAMSLPRVLRFGVPQGSVLGPVLFTICINGLASLLEGHCVLYHFYADDTQFYFQVENVVDAIDKIGSLLSDFKIWTTK